ncbi:SOS response-associated peptidase family protein [Sphingomonas sabuli]|uniref:Abasic site processing protein n=1 Tax=Sphingomonas sabuli TaxID=2764186 RepID=A0A7G9L0I4_9SPHN|nr:SOS response-associated peptidase family protein [Sphingomonas sabuli]QNM82133.1 SOS response-associated peptidase family protein [Sphingomonas sabuli]
MCNLYRIERSPDAIRRLFEDVQIPLTFPEGAPNIQPVDVRITDRAPVVRWNADHAELVVRRWSWPSSYGSPLFNLRSDGRNFPRDRALIPFDGFYEYTKPADPGQKTKDRWLFTPAEGRTFAIAGLIKDNPDVGEAFTLLTAPPGPDVAPLHGRQIVLLPSDVWRSWLDGSARSADLLVPTGPGELVVAPA